MTSHCSFSDEQGELYNIDDYTFLSRPRRNGKGGGVAFYINNSINWIRRFDLESKELECLWIEIFHKNSKSFLISVMYKPPVGSNYLQENFTTLLNLMLSLATKSTKEIILLGDLNTNYLDVNDNKDIKSIFKLFGFKQTIKDPTRITDHSVTQIDIILTNNPEVISSSTVIPIAFSDHDLIACVRKLNHRTFKPKTINFRDYKKYTPESMQGKISSHKDFEQVTKQNNVNTCWSMLKNIILSCLDDIAPKITKRIRGQSSPWLSVELKTLMNSRDILLRKSRKTKNPEDVQMYKRKKNEVNRLVKQAKKAYYKELLEKSADDPNSFWSTLKKLYPSAKASAPTMFKINKTPTSDKNEIVRAFCQYFSNVVTKLKEKAFPLRNCTWIYQATEPLRTCRKFKFKPVWESLVEKELKKLKRKKAIGLDGIPSFILKDCASTLTTPVTHIINLSFTTATFPTDWKKSKLIPTHKSGSQDDIENYRPISVIPSISKVIERIIHRQFSKYLEESDLLSNCQFGFRQKRSTELATTLFFDEIKNKVNEGKMVGVVFIDLSRAFDTISHAKLLQKLESYGVAGVELAWFSDYLFNRSHQVQMENVLSAEGKALSGVPQGSIIEPLLFVLFYNDFPSCLKHSKCIIYADDTVIYVPGTDIFIIESRLSADMEHIMHWYTHNELILNLKKGKTETMMFGTSKRLSMQPDHLNITFAYNTVNQTHSYKYLGILVDPTLNLNTYKDLVYKKSASRLRILYKIRPLMDTKCARTIYQSMILPLLNYCGTLQLNHKKTKQDRLDAFHHRAMHLCTQNLSEQKRVPSPTASNIIHSLTLVRQCLNGEVCSNFKNYFELANHGKNTRNAGALLKLPKLKLEYARSSFRYLGAALFNALPHSVRIIENTSKFKHALSQHIVG